MPHIIAVDFDGTLCEDKYPEIGEPIVEIIDFCKDMRKRNKIILWTCRTGKLLQDAVEWCKDKGLEFDAINENLPEIIEQYGGDSRKITADLYLDDKAGEVNAMRRKILCSWIDLYLERLKEMIK